MKHAILDSSTLKADVQIDERVACSNFQGGGLDVRKRLCAYSSLMNEDGQTKLHLLCQNNSCSKEEVQGLIEAFPAALQRRDVYGRSVRCFRRRHLKRYPSLFSKWLIPLIQSSLASLLCSEASLQR